MSQSQPPRSDHLASELTPSRERQTRLSEARVQHIREYVHGLLPAHTHSRVEVTISEHVETAAVVPASEDALLDGEHTDFTPNQASQLIDRVDGDYLVLVTGKPAPLNSVCLSDQLTADSAYQFGLAIHETLHILKTAFGALKTLIDDQVAPEHHDFVHQLINITEDGAIENEAITGDDFSQRAANRLTLINEALTQKPVDYPSQHEFTFGDALLKALHDRLIYKSGVTDLLIDETDTQFTFASEADEDAFNDIYDAIERLAADILSLRSDAPDEIHRNDKEASIKRIKRTLQFWEQDLKPLLVDQDQSDREGASDNPPDSDQSENSDTDGEDNCSTDSDAGEQDGSQSQTQDDSSPSESPSLETPASEDNRQSVAQYPSIGDEPDPDEIDHEKPEDDESHSAAGHNENPQTEPNAPDNDEINQDPSSDSPNADASSDEPSTSEEAATSTQAGEPSTNGQATFSDFAQSDTGSNETSTTTEEPESESDTASPENREQQASSDSTTDPSETEPAQEPTEDEIEDTNDQPNNNSQEDEHGGDDQANQSSSSQTEGSSNTHSPIHSENTLSPTDFESDRQQAEQTAETSTIDGDALNHDLEHLDGQLSNGDSTGEFDSIGDLDILPEPDTAAIPEIDWAEIEQSAALVGDTLAKELQLDQQTAHRDGLSSGTTVNVKTAHRLAYGDPRTFTESLPGDEKDYFIVLVLDRSASMSPSYHQDNTEGKISVATNGIARFSLACEQLDIDIAIIDFYNNTPRLVKPPSVATEFAKEQILNTETGGRTPLSDALSLARVLVDSNSRNSLIISMTDDKPSDIDAVVSEIAASYTPICSLTIATDCEYGNPPEKADKLQTKYDQTTTVYEPSQLEIRLDELASLLSHY